MIPSWAIRTLADKQAIEAGCYWDEEKAQKIIDFAQNDFRTQYVRGKLTLTLWQSRFLQSIYGWRNANGSRRFRYACLHIAKKNGKTLCVAIITAFEILYSEEPAAWVVSASTTADNSKKQVFADVKFALRSILGQNLARFCKITNNTRQIVIESLPARYDGLAADGDGVQGFNCSAVTLDEMHAHKSDSLYDSLRYAHKSRSNATIVMISTAGDDVSHFYYAIYTKAKKILAGDDLDVTFYAEVYEMDADGDPEDPVQWRKSNPSIGVAFSEQAFALDLKSAKQDPVEWLRFQRYQLNRWTRPDSVAPFDVQVFDEARQPHTEDQLKTYDLHLGVDLSQSVDPSSVGLCFVLPGSRYYVRAQGWVAREGVRLREKTSLPKWQQFSADGSIKITEGSRTDDEAIVNYILDLAKRYHVKSVTFDPYGMMGIASRLEKQGLKVYRMAQTYRYYSAPMKELQKAIVEKRILHDGGSWLRYCLGQVRWDQDRDGNVRPCTKTSLDHIDGFISVTMAYSQAIVNPLDVRASVYQGRGLVFV